MQTTRKRLSGRGVFLAGLLAAGVPPAGAQLAQSGAVSQYVSTGGDNTTAIYQDGSGLEASVSINGASNGTRQNYNLIQQEGEGSSASVSVTGDGNTFRVLQSAGSGVENNEAIADVVGFDNSAFISQINDLGGPYSNAAYIQQLGTLNTAIIGQTVQDGVGAIAFGAANEGAIYQTGDENYAEIQQRGTGNSATVAQDGYRNYGSITQTGAGSSLYLSQTGNYNSYVMSQTGCLVSSCPAIQVYQGGGTP